jgi:integrase
MATTYFFTPHSFRHTHTSLLIEAGVGIKEIPQRLGHTDIKLR